MKKVLSIMALLLIVGTAHAQINIAWQGLGGFTQPDGVSPLLNPYPGQFAWAHIVWTPDAAPAAVMPGATLTGNEVQLGDGFWIASDEWGSLAERIITTANTGVDYAPGNIFARIFDGVDAQDASLIGAGHHYYWGPLVALQDIDDPTAPQPYNMNRNQLGIGDPVGPGEMGVAWTNDGFNNTVIPEPSVMAMLGFGGLLLMIRRRFTIG